MKWQLVAWVGVATLPGFANAHATSGEAVGVVPPAQSTPGTGPTIQPAIAPPDGAVPLTGAAPLDNAPPSHARAAPAPERPNPVITLRVTIDLTKQQMTVKADGESSREWAISSAARGYLTPTGTFTPTWKARMWFSRQYDDAPMPHSIFFKDGIAIHGTESTRMLGRPASHGCVRLAPQNAAALYALVGKHGMASTQIIVRGAPRFNNEFVAGRPSGSQSRYADESRRREFEPRRSSNYVYGGNPFWAPWQW